ncbi:hypothetical protein GOFOIKOB_4233 [Methylobacterium tardum]|uniref:Uncharacterized protein n=1 Tax=Methylobacterium tardum TaxID=374432 RepID=A0AA37WVK0_9HYPH|nr:hypothetical protein GOFOIKOB_4233 [Methylobacterium tardum]GLS73227.1 hypothetical protein GCM10007890_52420 [Methylobacterium tardum]
MPDHYCINPLDPYADQEVLVTYELGCPLVLIRSVLNEDGYNILSELSDECVRILQVEISVYYEYIKPYEWAQDAIDTINVIVALRAT